MRIDSIEIGRWRNLTDLDIELNAGADFLCLVGENGTGKSGLLELIAYAATHLGLAQASPFKRLLPQDRREPFEVRVGLTVSVPADDLALDPGEMPSETQGFQAAWDGTLTFEAKGLSTQSSAYPLQPCLFGVGGPGYKAAGRVLAGGFENEVQAFHVANFITGRLQQRPEVLHLFLDAERVFPPAEVRDEEIINLARGASGARVVAPAGRRPHPEPLLGMDASPPR